MATKGNADTEIKAIQALLEALEPLDEQARDRVVVYAFERLGIASPKRPQAEVVAPQAPARPESPADAASPPGTDIRALKEEKNPRSANEMAAVVAYYLSELAPPHERKDTVGTADIEKYFKNGNYKLPQVPAQTLKNAAAAGYFDSVGRGSYRLNPVGYNLVAHNLPRPTREGSKSKGAGAKRGRSKRSTPKRTATKGKGARSGRRRPAKRSSSK